VKNFRFQKYIQKTRNVMENFTASLDNLTIFYNIFLKI